MQLFYFQGEYLDTRFFAFDCVISDYVFKNIRYYYYFSGVFVGEFEAVFKSVDN